MGDLGQGVGKRLQDNLDLLPQVVGLELVRISVQVGFEEGVGEGDNEQIRHNDVTIYACGF